jgi:hypothetical protein
MTEKSPSVLPPGVVVVDDVFEAFLRLLAASHERQKAFAAAVIDALAVADEDAGEGEGS